MNNDSAGAYIESEDALEHFGAALGGFAVSLTEELATIQRQGGAAVERIRDRRDSCAVHLQRLEAELDAEDESDSVAFQVAAIEAARAELERVTAILMLAEDHLARMNETILRLRPLAEAHIPIARKFLMDKVSLLRSYHAVRLDLDGSTDSTHPAARGDDKNAGGGLPSWEDITQVALPGGFVWVRLDDIALQDELKNVQHPGDFSKVAYDEMRSGAQRFVEHVLPVVAKDPSHATSEHFAELDRAAGVTYEHGLQRVFEAYLGRWTPIYLCRGQTDERFSITNGRHRIKVASDLGWTAVPAQVKDLRRYARGV
ncbi:MAG: hypothetical protein M9910_04715 [Kiritimatiellae bacterium]|nr:hypothetical protein [Kiritimatiellia bacterium]